MSTLDIVAIVTAPVMLIAAVIILHNFDKHIEEQTEERQDDE